MENTCHIAPENKKSYIRELGRKLKKEHGKKKFYTPEEVKKAHQDSVLANLDFVCWGMSVFSSHDDFDAYHEEAGESCDYVEMKTEMLQGLSLSINESWLDITDLDMDASCVEFGNLSEVVPWRNR